MITTIMELLSKCPFCMTAKTNDETGDIFDKQMKMPSICSRKHMGMLCMLSIIVLIIAGFMAKHHIANHRNGSLDEA